MLLALPLACTDASSDDDASADSAGASTTIDEPTGGSDGMPTDDGATPPDDSSGSTGTTDPDGSSGDDATTEPGTTGGVDQTPPVDPDALAAWLHDGEYLGWNAESGPHPSAGPHFGGVRTFVNDALFDSLDAGAAQHPMDAAAVKELYADGDTVRGWSVMVKVQPDSAGGDGWYWYELYDDGVLADGTGLGVCTGCHGGGTDYVLSPFPLQ
ncbi:MAG: hypothetical protein KC501_29865 [Myxococcales bacterium]|nr:hypothetical protein [Myxococcales bacterium]